MILYHGTNTDFDKIDIKQSNPYKDFGQGFYLTNLQHQAEELARKKAYIFGGTPTIQKYEFDEQALSDHSLNILVFEKPVKECWNGTCDKTFKANKMTKQQQTDYLIAHIIDEMTQYLMIDFKLDIVSALNVIYNSNVFVMVQDTKNELYIQSPSYIYELLKKEYLETSHISCQSPDKN